MPALLPPTVEAHTITWAHQVVTQINTGIIHMQATRPLWAATLLPLLAIRTRFAPCS